jgi:hypothetical protein
MKLMLGVSIGLLIITLQGGVKGQNQCKSEDGRLLRLVRTYNG